MKISNYINKSLSRQVISLMGISILFFLVGTGILFYLQHKMHNDYLEQRKETREKLLIIDEIHDQFNSEFLIMNNGSIAFEIPENTEQALNQESEIRNRVAELEKLSDTEVERSLYRDIADFTDYYFIEVLPPIIENGNEDRVAELTNGQVTSRVEGFLDQMESTNTLLRTQINDHTVELTEKQLDVQNIVIIFFILFLSLLVFIIRMIFRKVGKPLADFAFAANEIAAGRDAAITVDSSRKDELGSLSVAFQKMIDSVQAKEQDLLAHNEELIAQQDELHAQQNSLEETLDMVTEKEQKLKRRNELINGISASLDKDEVLQSIVKSMCRVIGADRGMITFLHEDTFASFGISDYGVAQFRKNLYSGFVQRLVSSKKGFTVKREQHAMEKGYHETLNYSYDLYIPILSRLQEVEAIMVFSRYGDPFSEEELTEYETLAKQIAVSLDKIKLFEQSEHSRRLNQDILNTVQEGIQLINKDREIVQINERLCEIFTRDSAEEMIGLSWDEWTSIMAEKIQETEFIESLEEAIIESNKCSDEEYSFIYRIKDSNQVIKVYGETLRYNGENHGTVLVHRDITKEYEVDNMKSEFVSTVSHELRTPLASILGFTELMITKELKPERKTKYLNTIYNEAKRLTALINDFLDIQRMESGKQTYEKKYIDIKPILQKVIELQEVNTTLHEIELVVELDRTMILGDSVKIEQVFINLISNSIKYSPNGGEISIRIYGNDELVSIDIQDEGLGIPEEALPHLFQKFYRVDNTDRRRIGGTGLGLSIVEEIVKAHGGRITVSSEYGKGSTFTIHFPKVIMKEEMQNSEGTSSTLNYNIMVVEDDLSLAELLQHELQDSGFQVSYFNSGTKALEQLKKVAPDAIVLDIMLGEDEIDGWTIMKKMKASEEWKDIPIFVSTALDEKELGFSLGAQDYLVKPYKPSQLSKLIMHTLLSNDRSGQIMVPKKV